QWPLMFSTIHSVYSSESPGAPNGTSGQLPGPSLFVKSMWTPPVPMSRRVIAAVAGQLAMSCGELYTVASPRFTPSFGAGALGLEGGGVGATGTAGVLNV